ncbi:MAG: CBS domain-containing protein [Streptosporangiaceae bacterium]
MRDLDFGSLPVGRDDDRLRDIVTKCIAPGVDPASVTSGDLAHSTPVAIESQADVTGVLRVMEQYQIHRLPVIESQQPVGMISQADLARHLPETLVGSSSKPSQRLLSVSARADREPRGVLTCAFLRP